MSVTTSNVLQTCSPCSPGVIDNITTRGSGSLNLSFDRPAVRSRHFFPIGAVRDSAVPATVGASVKGLWCSGWLNHDPLSPLCWSRPTQSRPWASPAPKRVKYRYFRFLGGRIDPRKLCHASKNAVGQCPEHQHTSTHITYAE